MRAKIVVSPNAVTMGNIDKYLAISGQDIESMVYVCDSQDIQPIIEHFGSLGEQYDLADISAAYVQVCDGDYGHIWVTKSSRPYDINARYHHIKLVLY